MKVRCVEQQAHTLSHKQEAEKELGMTPNLKASKGCVPSCKAKPPKPTQIVPPAENQSFEQLSSHIYYSLGLWSSSSEKASHLSFNGVLAQEVLDLLCAGGPLPSRLATASCPRCWHSGPRCEPNSTSSWNSGSAPQSQGTGQVIHIAPSHDWLPHPWHRIGPAPYGLCGGED